MVARTNCKRQACHAAIRIILPQATSVAHACAMTGLSKTSIHGFAETTGATLPTPRCAPRRISEAKLRSVWLSREKDIEESAATLGISGNTLWRRAMQLGLPNRPFGRLDRDVIWPAEFSQMWEAGVFVKEIAKACARRPKSLASVTSEAKARGLKPRRCGPQKNGISLVQYLMMKDAAAINAAAKATWREAA